MGAGHEANWDKLCAFTDEVMRQKGVPGVALGVLHQGEMATAGFGVTNVDHPLPVTDETLFQVGSVTKTFTGTLMTRLAEMDKVDLDATVRTYIPEFRVADEAASAQATIRHLLTHTGGWAGNFFIDTGPDDDALAKYVNRMAGLEQLAPVGTVWSIDNAGYALAGYIIERVTGLSYQKALKELVLEPLELNNTFLNPGDVMTHGFVVGHFGSEQGPKVARPWLLPRCLWSAGGIVCHVKDLLRYARFHLSDGCMEGENRLLSQKNMTLMQSSQVTIWDKETWGLSWAIDEIDSHRRVWHPGSTVGQHSLLVLIPQHDFAIAILTNGGRGREVYRAASRWALKAYLRLEEADPEPIDATADDLASFAGHYSRPFADIELGLLGGRLVGQVTWKAGFPTEDVPIPPPSPPFSLALCEKDRLLAMDGPFKNAKYEIVRKADGTIGWLRDEWWIHVRQT